MKGNDDIRNIRDDNNDMLEELQKMLEEEFAKSDNEIDFDKISEITQAIAELSGAEELDEETIEFRADEIISEADARDRRKGINKIYKWVSVLSACFVFAMALNFYTLSSFGTDLISTALKVTQNGFSLDFSQDIHEVPVVTSTDDNSEENTKATEKTSTPMNTTIEVAETTTEVAETTSGGEPAEATTEADGDIATTITENPTAITTTPGDEIVNPETTSSVVDGNDSRESTLTTSQNATEDFPTTTDLESTIAWRTETLPVTTTIANTTTEISETEITTPTAPEGIYLEGMQLMQVAENEGMKIAFPNMTFENYILTSYNIYSTDLSNDIYFKLQSSDGSKINISAEQYFNKEDIPSVLVPSEKFDVWFGSTELGTAYFFDENNQTTAVFVYDNTVYTVVGYDKAQIIVGDIVFSFVPYSEN